MFKKTGTTIVGIKFATGVAIFADTRSTMGDVVDDKNCYKMHRLANAIFCAGAGTAADTERVTRYAEHRLSVFKRKFGRDPFVLTAVNFFTSHLHKYRGEIGAALIVAGVDQSGARLFDVHPAGSSTESHFTALGSGSLAAMAVLESAYAPGLGEEGAVALGIAAVEAGIFNDLFSGSNVDYVVIDARGTRVFRNARVVCASAAGDKVRYPRNSVAVQREEVFHVVDEVFE